MSSARWCWVEEELALDVSSWANLEGRNVARDAVRVRARRRKKILIGLGKKGDVATVHLAWKSWVAVGKSYESGELANVTNWRREF